MPSGQLNLTISGDEARLLRSLDKVIAKEGRLRSGIKQTADQSKRAGRSMGAAFGARAVGQLTSVASGYLSISAAIGVVNRALEEKRRLDREQLDTNRSIGQAQAAVVKNLGDTTNKESEQFLRNVAKIQASLGFAEQQPLLQAASSVLSATGGNRQVTLDILRRSGQFFKDRPEQLPEFGGALADVIRVTGDKNVQRNLALLLAIQGQARFTELGAFKNVAPALAAGQIVTPNADRLRSTRETAALFAGIGQRAADPEGALTKTAVANLVRKLQEEFPDLDTTFERLEAARSADQETIDRLLSGGFRGATIPAIRDLITDAQSDASKMVQDAFNAIQASEEFAARKEQQLATLTPQLQLQNLGAASEANIQAFESGQLNVGAPLPRVSISGKDTPQIAAIREVLFETLEKTRGNNFLALLGEQALGLRFDLSATSPEAATDLAIKHLANRERILQAGRPLEQISAGEREQLALLERQIQLLEVLAGRDSPQAFEANLLRAEQNAARAAE